MGPLHGIKVLDLTRLLPGPYATLVLADLGAQVDKIEEPTGDYARHMPPMKDDTSGLFLGLNRNKRSAVIDLKTENGVAQLKQLVRQYDVLIESFRPGVMDRLGVGYEVLKKENEKLIYCSISGFGSTGPDAKRAGHDINFIARSGALGYGGDPRGPPSFPGVQMGDIGGSLFSVIGILAAIHERKTAGVGRFVDVSMTECSMSFLHMHLASRMAMGSQGTPLQRGREALNGGYPCYGLYRTKDHRYLAVGSLEPHFFLRLLESIDRAELMDGAYDIGPDGKKTREALESVFSQRNLSEWILHFRSIDVCVEPVLEGDEVFNDEQLKSRGVFAEAFGNQWLLTPLRMHSIEVARAPTLGEHTNEILREAGISQ
jgi:alpha-methylacyl-CoA racemase